ncbi:hypothetical protein KRR39_01370 [Nocardioides panacis]|uniref:Uncharacterized protein n=1 Tax=Nocardioides panacis TaxID=2849501 RepID=A0A975SZ12_9ACTN|nr:hypothetical protein [Nocardioides panacis]QWZ08552.1 hypothetical protein KRR39_01370 [Nocardioides panacis]
MHPVTLDPDGVSGPTRGAARGRAWRRSSHGLYVPASADDDLPEQRIVEQAARLPPGGAVTGWAACRLHGAAFFDGLHTDGRTQRDGDGCGRGPGLRAPDACLPRHARRQPWRTTGVGRPRPLRRAQPVFDRGGRLLGIVDLLDVAAGLEVFRVTGPDLLSTDRGVRRMLAARARSRWEVPPTLDEVLDHRDVPRSLHEPARHRE